ncbi:MAG TPA: 2Fe-2S iron-sulfur cluster-binding protein [Actinomycetes bacterium]
MAPARLWSLQSFVKAGGPRSIGRVSMQADSTISVNGAARIVRCDPLTSLLQVLRGQLGLLGSRFGCGLGGCGACMVLLDGRPATACDIPMRSVGGAQVTTIEGLAATSRSCGALVTAFASEQAGQCGYCLSGILVTATALLENLPAGGVSEEAVRVSLDRHLCRCGAHQRIVRAVIRAASTGTAADEPAAQPPS